MNRYCAMLGALSMALAPAAARADWTQYAANPEHQVVTSEQLSAPLGVLWKYQTIKYAGRSGNNGGPVVRDGTVYFSSRNQILAANADTGELLWKVPEAETDDPNLALISATPCVGPETLFVPTSDGTMTAYNRSDGTALWAFRAGESIECAPVVLGQRLYFGANDGFFYCIDAGTGKLIWKSNSRGRDKPFGDDVTSAPVVYAGVIYATTGDQMMHGIQLDNGRVLWSKRMVAASSDRDNAPVAMGNRIYTVAGTSMFEFRLRGGTYRSYPMGQYVGNEITTTPIVTENFWFFGDRDGHFYAMLSNGKPASTAKGEPWKVKLEGQCQGVPIMTTDTIFVSTNKGFIYGIDIPTGEVKWNFRNEAPKGIDKLYAYYPVRAPLAMSNGKLFALGDDGTLTCFTADAPDYEGPVFTSPRPTQGTVMNGYPPISFSIFMWDEGTGIDPDSIELSLDGRPLPRSTTSWELKVADRDGWIYNPLRRILTYTLPKAPEGQVETPLPDGPHIVQIRAADWRGNEAARSWNFVVDNRIPRNAVAVKPTTGKRAGDKTSPNQPGQQGGYPGGPGGAGGPGGQYPGMGQQGQGGRVFRGRFGNYRYNRGNQRMRGFGGMGGGFGGMGGGMGGFGGMGGGMGGGGFGY